MRRSLPILLIFAALAAEVPAVTLSDSEKVALVFPFQVGQVYEFKAGAPFYRLNREVWPADSVATITIADTVIDGKTYFHIPYWSPFWPTEYYRLDDSMRVWHSAPYLRPEEVVMDLGAGGWLGKLEAYCPPLVFPYAVGISYISWCSAGDPSIGTLAWGWTTADTGSAFLHVMIQPPSSTWVIDAFHGAYGPGSSLHATGRCGISGNPPTCEYEAGGAWGLFRPKSDDPWPKFVTPVNVREHKNACCPRLPRVGVLAFPNPFNASVSLRYTVPQDGVVSLQIHALTGQLVRTLVNERAMPGTHTAVWDGRDDASQQVASGPYFARLITDNQSICAQFTLAR